MERGLYAAATGMVALQAMQDVLAQNMANAHTAGYKQDNRVYSALQGQAIRRLAQGTTRGPRIGELGVGVLAGPMFVDWRPGPLSRTDNPLDVSFGDNQFLAVRTPRGERYTRAGNLQLDGNGRLLTASGLEVLDAADRPIVVAAGGRVTLDSRGNVLVGGTPVARVKIVEANTGQLVKEGESLFAPVGAGAVRLAASPVVRVGTLEQSNMDPVRGMVQLLMVSRSFEMAQRALTTQDELLRQAAVELGKV
ncbi:MAG: flagellar hook-basal body protein [Chloroherpetonaceae bacterium]|nr:flagellar hook-basal body protein [Chthonomonadaceae bacterium]MDW8207718.1 flagellar hook-basal body protein [Chloroherpetonaceae bacterium]